MRPIPATACTIFAALWCASAAAMDAPQPPDYLVQGSLPPTPAAAPGTTRVPAQPARFGPRAMVTPSPVSTIGR